MLIPGLILLIEGEFRNWGFIPIMSLQLSQLTGFENEISEKVNKMSTVLLRRHQETRPKEKEEGNYMKI